MSTCGECEHLISIKDGIGICNNQYSVYYNLYKASYCERHDYFGCSTVEPILIHENDQFKKIQSEIDEISLKLKQLPLIPGYVKNSLEIINYSVKLDNRRKELQMRRWNVLQFIKRKGGL